ncbi:hypothetical protein Tco_1257711 [Tanacetum coccineum]
MGRDTIQLENAISTISQEYLLEFTSEYGILEGLHPELPGPEDTIVGFPKGKVDMDLFNLISTPNPTKVKTGTRPRAAHEVSLLTITASRVIDMEDPTTAIESSGTPSTIEKSPLDFAIENLSQQITKGDGTEDQSTRGGKFLMSMRLEVDTTFVTPATQEALSDAKSVSDPDPLSYARPQPHPERDMTQSSKETTPEIPSEHVATAETAKESHGQNCQTRSEDTSEGRGNKKLEQEINSLRIVETEVKGLRNQTRNLGTLLEAEVNMKKVAETKNAELTEELESLRAQFTDLQVSND